jgi:hypothetical protein
MAGFLDKDTSVVDMILTSYGKEMLAKGEFDVMYYAFFDDVVDYAASVSESGSLTVEQMSGSHVDELEVTLVSEAVPGMLHGMDLRAMDTTNVNKPVFTMPQGQKTLSVARYDPTGSFETVRMRQRKVVDVYRTKDALGNVQEIIEKDRGFEIIDSSRVSVNMSIDEFFEYGADDGFLLRVYVSGSRYVDSNGYVELDPKRDFDYMISFGDLVRVLLDSEVDRFDNTMQNRRKKKIDKTVGLASGMNK